MIIIVNTEFKESLSKRLKEAREKTGLSRQKLATKANISTSALYYYEKGDQIPSAEILLSISKALRVSVDYLLGLTDIPILQEPGSELLPSYLKLLPVYECQGKIDISNFPKQFPIVEYGTLNKRFFADYGVKVHLEDYPIFFLSNDSEGGIIWVDEKGKDELYSGIFVVSVIDNKLSVRQFIKDVESGNILLISLARGELPIVIEKENINSYVNSHIIGRVFAWNAFWPTEEVSNHK